MQNWKTILLFAALSTFVCAGLARNSLAQQPANMIQQPGQLAPGQGQAPIAGQMQGAVQMLGVPNHGAAQNPAAIPVAPMGQAPFPALAPQHQKYLDDVLVAWEKSTKGIERFQCKFSRWQYDPTKTNNPAEFYTGASGILRYMAPDKGLFKVEELLFRKQKPNGDWGYEAIADQFGEWWICDGESVHLYDRTQKVAKKYPLPPNMRGAEVFNSPLPFVFGVDAQKVNSRFWVRPLQPPSDQVILLEAYPKHQSDAMNYHHVNIYLDRKEILPVSIVIYLPQWTPEAQGDHKEVFEFRDREVNAGLIAKLTEAVFRQSFIPIEPPKGWTVQEVPFVPEDDAQRVAAPAGQQQNQLPR